MNPYCTNFRDILDERIRAISSRPNGSTNARCAENMLEELRRLLQKAMLTPEDFEQFKRQLCR